MPEAVPTHPRMSPKTPKQSPHSEARDGSRSRTVDMGPHCRLEGTARLLHTPMDGQGPQQTDKQGGHRIIFNPAPLPSQGQFLLISPSQGQFQLISPQRSSHVGRRGDSGLACSCLLPPCPPRPGYLCDSLSLISNHSNTLPWLGTVTAGYLLIFTRALPPKGQS